MARFIGVWQKFKDIIKDVLGYGIDRTGTIVLGYGKHELRVRTGARPEHVYFCVCEPRFIPVCHGNINMIGVSTTHHGFILYADIQSETCEIEWIAEYC